MSGLPLDCVLLGDDQQPMGDIFRVHVALDSHTSELKDRIFEDGPTFPRNSRIRATDFKLWKPRSALAAYPWETLCSNISQFLLNDESSDVARIRSTSVKNEFRDPLPADCVHALVQLPESIIGGGHKRYRGK